MQVHQNIQQLPSFTNAVITIGTFDGVHTGHRKIIDLMKEQAQKVNGETVIITFHPHPRQVISHQQTPLYLLNTLAEKTTVLEQCGIDHLVVVPFTTQFAAQSAEDYISNFLVKTFHPHTVIIGHDHRFGKGREGDFQLLEDKAAFYGYEVKEIPGFMLQNVTISSTRIREALLKGDVATADEYLGYPYFFSGKVVAGNKLGRTIGFPTANIETEDEHKLVPGNGVYAVMITDASAQQHRGMMNIGVRPTIGGTKRVTEVNIFDFEKEIYGERLTIHVKQHLRSEKKFNGLEELKQQLAEDKRLAIECLR